MATEVQIDAAARAIREVHSARIWATASVCGPPTPWDNLKEHWRQAYRDEHVSRENKGRLGGLKGHFTIIPAAQTGEPLWTLPLVEAPKLEQLQAGVGGHIEAVPGFTVVSFKGEPLQRCVAFCNEEGKLHGLPQNFLATSFWQFALRYNGHPGLIEMHADGTATQVDFLVGDIAVITGDDELLEAL